MRTDGRTPDQLRDIKLTADVIDHAEGSVEICYGKTKVICTASLEEGIPKWLAGSGSGWITAEYGMLPRSTHSRIKRDKALNGGRTQEISRLIGRSLRAAVDLNALGEKQISIDCDVIQADGGTRTAAITGGFVALCLALDFLKKQGQLNSNPIGSYVAAISVGLKNGQPLIDLNYDEDSTIHTDMNFVMDSKGKLIEVQGTAEGEAFSRDELNQMLDLASDGCQFLFKKQAELISEFLGPVE